ncbi:hypothetical protein I3843_14G052200 [Carya illinoinensis]|nr:hypothetical protein I3843_14G052200 [Carya illinoinensis]
MHQLFDLGRDGAGGLLRGHRGSRCWFQHRCRRQGHMQLHHGWSFTYPIDQLRLSCHTARGMWHSLSLQNHINYRLFQGGLSLSCAVSLVHFLAK